MYARIPAARRRTAPRRRTAALPIARRRPVLVWVVNARGRGAAAGVTAP